MVNIKLITIIVKRKAVNKVLLSFLFFTQACLFCGKSTAELQDLHKKISEGLIKIRKESPQLQLDVYTILDHVGKLSRLTSNTIQKKKKLKELVQNEKQTYFTVKVENEKLKSALLNLKEEVHGESQRFAENERRLQILLKEKNVLLKQNQEIKNKEEEYKNKVKELEANFAKPQQQTFIEPSHRTLSKNKDNFQLVNV